MVLRLSPPVTARYQTNAWTNTECTGASDDYRCGLLTRREMASLGPLGSARFTILSGLCLMTTPVSLDHVLAMI